MVYVVYAARWTVCFVNCYTAGSLQSNKAPLFNFSMRRKIYSTKSACFTCSHLCRRLPFTVFTRSADGRSPSPTLLFPKVNNKHFCEKPETEVLTDDDKEEKENCKLLSRGITETRTTFNLSEHHSLKRQARSAYFEFNTHAYGFFTRCECGLCVVLSDFKPGVHVLKGNRQQTSDIVCFITTHERVPSVAQWKDKKNFLCASCEDASKLQEKNMVEYYHRCVSILRGRKQKILFLFFCGKLKLQKIGMERRWLGLLLKIIKNTGILFQGNIIGFKGELIHMYNKNRTSVATPEYFHNVKEKTNIVLLGDSLGDLGMLGDMESQEVVLRIGFLNNKIEERLQQYMNSFDIVLIDDQTMDVVNGILRKIIY
ncbi:unnamed protein product [Ixodes pacificus]